MLKTCIYLLFADLHTIRWCIFLGSETQTKAPNRGPFVCSRDGSPDGGGRGGAVSRINAADPCLQDRRKSELPDQNRRKP